MLKKSDFNKKYKTIYKKLFSIDRFNYSKQINLDHFTTVNDRGV